VIAPKSRRSTTRKRASLIDVCATLCRPTDLWLCDECRHTTPDGVAALCLGLECLHALTTHIQGQTDFHANNLKATFVRNGGLYALWWPANCAELSERHSAFATKGCHIAQQVNSVLTQAHKHFGKHSLTRFERANQAIRRRRDYAIASATLDDRFGLSSAASSGTTVSAVYIYARGLAGQSHNHTFLI
jgi:hypothetical protein